MSDAARSSVGEWAPRGSQPGADLLASLRQRGIQAVGRGDRVWMWWTPRWATAPRRAWDFRTGGLQGAPLRARLREEAQEMLKKTERPKVAEDQAVGPVSGAFAKAHPLLWSHLTQRKWEDGSPRELSSFTVFVGDGLFKCVLKDKDAKLTLWVAVRALPDLFEALEAALANPQAEWRKEREHEGDQAKRVKRKGS